MACRLTAKSPESDRCTSFFAQSGVRGRANALSWANLAANPHHPGLATRFFSATDRPVEPLLFGLDLGLGRGHAHDGGARKRWIAARMARIIGPVTATSANWKVMVRAWRTTRAPILINLS